MSGARLHTLLPELTSRQPVMVIGAAVTLMPSPGVGAISN